MVLGIVSALKVTVRSVAPRPGAEAQKEARWGLCMGISKFIVNVSQIFPTHQVSFKMASSYPEIAFSY